MACLVVFAQALLAIHEVSHASQISYDVGQEEVVCITCLALSGIHGAPPLAQATPLKHFSESTGAVAFLSAIIPSAPLRYFLTRAPPVSLS